MLIQILMSSILSFIPLHASTDVSPAHHHKPVCSSAHWKRTMTSDEKWIATRESGMDPTPTDVNPSSGARELGQLLPSTEAGIHVKPTWKPCGEIHNMRVYIHERYGSESNAVSFWRAHDWY